MLCFQNIFINTSTIIFWPSIIADIIMMPLSYALRNNYEECYGIVVYVYSMHIQDHDSCFHLVTSYVLVFVPAP